MTLQQLSYFVELAETLHFTRASQKLFITQSTLSYAISGLEHELDVPLFVRESGKSISLTNYGRELLPLARQVLADADHIEEHMRSLRNPMSGVVTVAYSYINGNRFLPKMFGSLSRLPQFKDITINFEVNHRRVHFESDVAQGNIDLAFSCTRYTEGLEVVPFARQQLYVMLPTWHPLAERESLTVADIADDVLIGYDLGRNLDAWIGEMFHRHGLRPNIDSYTEEWMEQVSQVSLGKGIAILPKLPVESDLLSAVPLCDEMQARNIYMMWAKNHPLSPAVQYVRDCCLKYFDEPPLV